MSKRSDLRHFIVLEHYPDQDEIGRILGGYPRDLQETATQLVIRQAEGRTKG